MRRWRWVLGAVIIAIVGLGLYAATSRNRPPFEFLAGRQPASITFIEEGVEVTGMLPGLSTRTRSYEFRADYEKVRTAAAPELEANGWNVLASTPYTESWGGKGFVGVKKGRLRDNESFTPGWVSVTVIEVQPDWRARLKRTFGF